MSLLPCLKIRHLVSVIGFEELTRKGQLIIASTYGSLEIWTAVGDYLPYYGLCLLPVSSPS